MYKVRNTQMVLLDEVNPEGREYPLGDKGGGPLAVEDLNKIVNKKK